MKTLIKECGDVLTLNVITLGITFTQIEMMLKIILLLLSIIYTGNKILKSRR